MAYETSYDLKSSEKLKTDMSEQDLQDVYDLFEKISDQECIDCWTAIGIYSVDNGIKVSQKCDKRLKRAILALQRRGKIFSEE